MSSHGGETHPSRLMRDGHPVSRATPGHHGHATVALGLLPCPCSVRAAQGAAPLLQAPWAPDVQGLRVEFCKVWRIFSNERPFLGTRELPRCSATRSALATATEGEAPV